MNEEIISMAIERKVLLIEGMTCVNCQNRIEQALRNIAGISKVYVSYSKGQAEIEFDNDILTQDRIIAVIQNLDYKVVKKRKKDYSEFVNRAVTFAIIILLYCLLQRFGILNLLVPSMLADSKMSYGMLLTGGGGMGIPLLLQGILKIIAGLFMVIMGINMLGWIPLLRKLQIRFPQRLADKINKKRRRENRPFFVGLLNGLMPCGPMQSMQIIALGSGNPVSGAAAMLMFSLGTVPLMLGFGSMVSALGKKYTKIVMRVGSVLVVVLGLAMLSQGVNLSGINMYRTGTESADTEELNVAKISASGDMQYVNSELDFGTYPKITVYSGIPVKWTINVPEEVINGCNYKMVINTYGITHEFTPGENVIEFTPGESGTVQYTCWMGMINGKINITNAGE